MTREVKQQASPDTVTALADNKAVRNSVFIGSGVIALGTAVFSIWQEFFNEIKRTEPFKGFRNEKNATKDIAGLQHQAGKITTEALHKIERTAEQTYTSKVGQALEARGIPKGRLLGTVARVQRLGNYDLGAIAMKTGASLALTLGGYYLVNQNVRLKASNQQQDDRLRELGDRIDAQEARRNELYERGMSASR